MNKLTSEQIQALTDAQNLIARVQRQIELRLPDGQTTFMAPDDHAGIYDRRRVTALGETYSKLNHILNGDSL